MKKNNAKVLTLIALAGTMAAGCQLLKDVDYTVTPDPLEMHGDSVRVKVDVIFPEKALNKKAIVDITPSVGDVTLKPVRVQGEKATGNGNVIAYKAGGTVTYTDVVVYHPSMEASGLFVEGKIYKGEKEKATELMKKARAASPDDKSLMYAEAELYYTSGDMTNYKKIINELIKSDPNNPDLYYNLGVASARNGEKKEAMGYYSKAIELNPDYAEALINKAQLILDGERTIIDEMNSLGTSNADYDRYDVLKEEKNKLYSDALPYLESASRLRPDSMDIVRTLKGIYGLLSMDAKEKEMGLILDQN